MLSLFSERLPLAKKCAGLCTIVCAFLFVCIFVCVHMLNVIKVNLKLKRWHLMLL